MYTLSVFGTDNHWTFLIWLYCTYDLIQCSAALKVTLVTARNSTSYLSLAFNVLTNFTSSFFFFKVIYRKPRSGRTLPQKKTPKNRFHKEKKDSICGEWKWETIALIKKKKKKKADFRLHFVRATCWQCLLNNEMRCQRLCAFRTALCIFIPEFHLYCFFIIILVPRTPSFWFK